VEVVDSGHPPCVGTSGTVVDETRNTLAVETDAGTRTVPKRGQRFTFTTRDGASVTLDGSRIEARPADRIKDAP
jgi:RNase P/RNase MRP subunit p29